MLRMKQTGNIAQSKSVLLNMAGHWGHLSQGVNG